MILTVRYVQSCTFQNFKLQVMFAAFAYKAWTTQIVVHLTLQNHKPFFPGRGGNNLVIQHP
jgi:hypothetical protein